MLDPALMTASPVVGAYRAKPFSVAEIDAHSDAARLWATISAMREDVAEDVERQVEEAADNTEDEIDLAVAEERETVKRLAIDAVVSPLWRLLRPIAQKAGVGDGDAYEIATNLREALRGRIDAI